MGFSLAFIILDFLGNMGESVGPASSVYLFLFPWANLQKSPSSKPRMLSGKGVVFLGTADNSRCLNKKNKLPFNLQPSPPCTELCRERWRVYIVDRHVNPSQMQGGFNKSWTRIARRPLRTLFYHILPLGFPKT